VTNEQLKEIEKDAARRDEATATILMLVKAVREARERDEGYFKSMEAYRLDVEDCRRRMGDLLDQCVKEQADAHQFRKERDESRAEVERLRDLIDTVIRNCMECYDKRECQSCAWLREGTGGKP